MKMYPCVITTCLTFFAIIAVLLLVRFAVEISEEDKMMEAKFVGRIKAVSQNSIFALRENSRNYYANDLEINDRFPYVAAIIRNTSSMWSCACFASVVLINWVVMSAHCRSLEMKAACIILTLIIIMAILAVGIMVKFATDITVEEKKREYNYGGGIYEMTNDMGVISFRSNSSNTMSVAERFPYVAAITRNTSMLWTFGCFASVICNKWVVTSAHCRRPGATHRVLLYNDFVRNYTHTYPILIWRLHEKFDISNPTPKYDIAVAKLNVDYSPVITLKPALFDGSKVVFAEASIWKTVSTMDHKLYLTNEFDKYEVAIANLNKCTEYYKIDLDESMICIDMSAYSDCFINEFGPIYFGDKLVGILAVKSNECKVKLAIFTNVSYYTSWILKSTHTTYYG